MCIDSDAPLASAYGAPESGHYVVGAGSPTHPRMIDAVVDAAEEGGVVPRRRRPRVDGLGAVWRLAAHPALCDGPHYVHLPGDDLAKGLIEATVCTRRRTEGGPARHGRDLRR